MRLKAPVYSYDDLRRRAARFLSEYNESGQIPVPIEQIIEFRFQIDIIPIYRLRRDFDVDAFLSNDLKHLMVDQEAMESRSPNRYRFSLAHELAHAVLHQNVYAQICFSDLEEWKTLIEGLPEADLEWLEWQAPNFAGLILVPGEQLKQRMEEGIRLAAQGGFSIADSPDVAKDYICTWLGRQFAVSSQVIEKRLDKDGLWPPPRD